MSGREAWQQHYRRPRARQSYPDENLVRFLASTSRKRGDSCAALDFGCGSGRHLQLLSEFGYEKIYGCDTSSEALKLSAEQFPEAELMLWQSGEPLPIESGTLDVVVLWGVLHYNSAEERDEILSEIRRVLRSGGAIYGTLRSTNESHYQNNRDIHAAAIELFTLEECQQLLVRYFSAVEIGYIERRPPGELDRVVAHWLFAGRKE